MRWAKQHAAKIRFNLHHLYCNLNLTLYCNRKPIRCAGATRLTNQVLSKPGEVAVAKVVYTDYDTRGNRENSESWGNAASCERRFDMTDINFYFSQSSQGKYFIFLE